MENEVSWVRWKQLIVSQRNLSRVTEYLVCNNTKHRSTSDETSDWVSTTNLCLISYQQPWTTFILLDWILVNVLSLLPLLVCGTVSRQTSGTRLHCHSFRNKLKTFMFHKYMPTLVYFLCPSCCAVVIVHSWSVSCCKLVYIASCYWATSISPIGIDVTVPWHGSVCLSVSPLELHLTTSELWFGQEQEGILP